MSVKDSATTGGPASGLYRLLLPELDKILMSIEDLRKEQGTLLEVVCEEFCVCLGLRTSEVPIKRLELRK
jgi:hypothetical protein